MYYDYNYLHNNKVGIGWLDITDRITDTTLLSFTKNITEYWVQETACHSLPTIFKKSIDELLSWAEYQQLNYILISATGNSLDHNEPLLQTISRYIHENPDVSIVGHILDKGDKFYEIHHQCLLVNVKWWINANRPKFGEESNIPLTTIAPIRSDGNHHDEYTPIWVKQGTDQVTYIGRRQGWNLLKVAIETTAQVNSWPRYIRDSKFYLYPEVNSYSDRKVSKIISKLQNYTHFIANTEAPPVIDLTKVGGNFDTVISPGSGITPLLTAWAAGLQAGDQLKIYDVSPVAIFVQQQIRDKKINFRNFKEDFNKIWKDVFDNTLNDLLRAEANIGKMQEIINKLLPKGLGDFIDNVWPKLNVSYATIDMFDQYAVSRLLSTIAHRDKIYLHLTNIFYYQNTAWIHSANARYGAELDLLKCVANVGIDKIYIKNIRMSRKYIGWNTVTPRQIYNNPTMLELEEALKEIPWYKSI